MLTLQVTERVASLLEATASCSKVTEVVRSDAHRLRGAETIPWDNLKEIAEEYRKANPGQPVHLHNLCSKKDIVLLAPPAKERSPELQARLARLQEELENKRYSEMVADITVNERKAEEMRGSILPSSRLQLSFGAHVIVTMFTFWAVSYYGSKYYLSYNELWAGLAGALGLTAGMLLETLLLIIRSNRPAPLEERMPELFDQAKVQEAYDKVRQMKRAEAEQRKEQKGQAKPSNGSSAAAAAAGTGGASKQATKQQQQQQESKKSR